MNPEISTSCIYENNFFSSLQITWKKQEIRRSIFKTIEFYSLLQISFLITKTKTKKLA